MKWFRRMMLAVLAAIGAGCRSVESTAKIPAVTPFAVPQYLGTWHEAARMPQWFEKGMTAVTAEYWQEPDGTIRVCNRGVRDGKVQSARGVVRQLRENTGELEVSFFRPFYGKYRVVALAEDYAAALVIGDTKDAAWILVRDPADAEHFLTEYRTLLEQWGFDVSRLEFP